MATRFFDVTSGAPGTVVIICSNAANATAAAACR
jgi:hypothetical protein